MGNVSLILLMACGIGFCGLAQLVSKLIAPTSKNLQKLQAYECGVPTIGASWIQFNVGYYLFALIFLVFDVELMFLFPWAVVNKEMGITAFIEIVIFIFILFLGLLYAWKKGALKWM